jgi:erythromycin esterase
MEHQPAGAKAVLWAHNGHVERRAGPMGGHLDAIYGSAMRVVGFALGDGAYTASGPRGWTTYPAESPPPGSVESVMRATGIPRFALDLRAASHDARGRWLLEPHDFRAIGAMATDRTFTPTPVATRFDLLVYLDQTSATEPMPGVGRR